MSLRAFHLFFIGASVLMCLLVGAWGVREFAAAGAAGGLTLGAACFVLGFALLVYGVRVYRKLMELGP